MTRLNIRKHLLKSGAPEGGPGKAVVDISIIDLEFRLVRDIVIENKLLIINGISALFVVLDRKADIEGGTDIDSDMIDKLLRCRLSAFSCHQPALLSSRFACSICSAKRTAF